ncbi:MAG: hypothetical protein J7K40_04500 [candidate division Zixibacteria bacterium]|nr:hypothetical protein [candidate division Zixibacteria bacterium]
MKNTEQHKDKRKHIFISIYLIIAFAAYFLSFVLSRIDRIKGLLGL